MKLKDFIDQGKLDLTDLSFVYDGGTGYPINSEIRPEEFITFAKADFLKSDTRGLVNALCNAKRAIDCQTDGFLRVNALAVDGLEKQLRPCGVASLSFGTTQRDGPLKFRLLRALGIATPELITRMRRLRNLLEHEYRKPRPADVRNAIGIAELFVQACRGRMQSCFQSIWIGSGNPRPMESVEKEFRIWYTHETTPYFDVKFLENGWRLKNQNRKSPSLRVRVGEEGFMPLLKLIWHVDFYGDMTDPIRSFFLELGFRLPARFRVRDRHDL